MGIIVTLLVQYCDTVPASIKGIEYENFLMLSYKGSAYEGQFTGSNFC